MNFESPYVALPSRLTVRENLTVFGRLYGVPNVKARIDATCAGVRSRRHPRSGDRQAFGRTEDPGLRRQGADQPARSAVARRADRVARS